MTTIVLTDRLLRDALAPMASSTAPAELAHAVSERTHRRRQARRMALPWFMPPAATHADERRVRLVRVLLLASLLAATTGLAIAGARLLLHPQAPPQVLFLQGGIGYSVPIGGGERRQITALNGRNIIDFSFALDGSLLATLRDPRGVLEIWDAADVLNGQATAPILLPDTAGLQVVDTGAWRPDGSGLLITASQHGARRVFLVDVATGSTKQVSPPDVSVDDWQPSFDGRWLEIAGQYEGHLGIFLVDLTDLSSRTMVGTIGERHPEGGALGWSPDSRTMTYHLQQGLADLGIWRIDVDGTNERQVTPPGQPAAWMNWSPDGQWIAYETDAVQPTCATASNRRAVWIVRPDGTAARSLAEDAMAVQWGDDSRSMIVASALPGPDSPLGGVIHAFLDGSAPKLVYAYTDADNNGDGKNCYRYAAITKFYRALARGIRGIH